MVLRVGCTPITSTPWVYGIEAACKAIIKVRAIIRVRGCGLKGRVYTTNIHAMAAVYGIEAASLGKEGVVLRRRVWSLNAHAMAMVYGIQAACKGLWWVL